jgi:adenylosuccinate lyase
VINRYTPDDFVHLWSAENKYSTWLLVELSACEAMELEGLVPAGTRARIESLHVRIDPHRIGELEETTRHDVIAFLSHVEEIVGQDARWLHLGMTSSDVTDTASAILLRDACDKLLGRVDKLVLSLARRADEHRHTRVCGRTHGMSAEPTTFGHILAGYLSEMTRARKRLETAREEISVGTISGAVGTFSHFGTRVESRALAALGLMPETAPTQIVARDRHAAFFNALALVAGSIERFAVQMRHWQRTEVGEVEEPFRSGQMGSSAMPHKRNPITSENLCGLSRLMRSYAHAAMENTALWHERDISHSSVERVIGPDATSVLAYMLDRTVHLVDKMVVHPDAMEANLSRAVWSSEFLLLALVRRGLHRQSAYKIVQSHARAAHESGKGFMSLVMSDPGVMSVLDESTVLSCFDVSTSLLHTDTVIDRAIRASGVR